MAGIRFSHLLVGNEIIKQIAKWGWAKRSFR